MNALKEMVEEARKRARRLAAGPPLEVRVGSRRRSLREAIERAPRVPLIGEIKRASPSAGDIKPDADVLEVARAMVRGGAIALSVLTEPRYFKGDVRHLPILRGALDVPILRKDFIVDERQLHESARLGADAVLLIAGVLGERLPCFLDLTRELGMEGLVEVADERELELAVSAGAGLIGINNRDLRTMKVDLGRTARLAPLVPEHVTLVSESGIRTPEDVRAVLEAGADAVLVGTAIMGSNDIEEAVRRLVNAR
ncbi:MAG: indole-3-glycerol-phosphate synthase [Hadesarchaea archaeon]|nr:indole-3-glycerol-phosphate synthase [Hadesarchaea archaeon]